MLAQWFPYFSNDLCLQVPYNFHTGGPLGCGCGGKGYSRYVFAEIGINIDADKETTSQKIFP